MGPMVDLDQSQYSSVVFAGAFLPTSTLCRCQSSSQVAPEHKYGGGFRAFAFSKTRLSMTLAGRGSDAGIPGKLCLLLQHEDVLACLLQLHRLQIQECDEETPLNLGEGFASSFFSDILQKYPLVSPVAEALAQEALPGDPEPEATGVWASSAWAAAKRITTALRTTLCGMSLSPVISGAEVSQQEMIAAALLIAAGRMTAAIFHWWKGLQGSFRRALPMHLMCTLTISLQSISAAMYPLMSGPRRQQCGGALMHVSLFACICASSIQLQVKEARGEGEEDTVPSTSTSTTASSSSTASSSGAISSWVAGGTAMIGSKNSSSTSASSGTPALAGGGGRRGRQGRNQGRRPVVSNHKSATDADKDAAPLLGADLVRVLDLEGALVAAYTVFSRAIRFIMSFSLEHLSGIITIDSALQVALCATLALHTHSTCAMPTTAPATYLLHRHPGHGSARAAAEGLDDYLHGTVWAPDRFSLGPAPAALAGAESVAFIVTALVGAEAVINKEDMLACLRLVIVMNKLARAMTAEAADPSFQRSCQTREVQKTWMATCTAMCKIVSVQFKATRCIAEAVSHSNVHPDVLALWPLLSSAALQLAHAALGCIHVINTKLKMTGGQGGLQAGVTDLDLLDAAQSSLDIYTDLVHAAACLLGPKADTAAGGGPTPEKKGAVPDATQTHTGIASSLADHVPPEFARYCVAVATWAPNLKHVWGLSKGIISALDSATHALGSRSASWLPDTTLDSLQRLLSMFRDLTEDGVTISGAVRGDLAGWLGDLAPAYGGLDSTHLLYRMCCLYACTSRMLPVHPVIGSILGHLEFRSSHLIPFLAMVFQVAPAAQQHKHLSSSSSSNPAAHAAQQEQQRDHSKGSQRSTTHTRAAPAHHTTPYSANLHTRFIEALQCSQTFLEFLASTELRICGQLGVTGAVLDLAQEWLQLPSDQPTLREGALAMAAQSSFQIRPAAKDALCKLVQSYQPDIWEASWRVTCRPQQEAGHVRLLETYITDVAARVIQGHPGLKAEVLEALDGKE